MGETRVCDPFGRGSKTPFRILIVDDVLVKGNGGVDALAVQDAIRNYFGSLRELRGRDVFVDFAGTPEVGVTKWQNEIYDLTLVDSDFIKSSNKVDDKDKRSFLDLDVEFVGAYLFLFLCKMISKDNDGLRFRDGCKIALWTGLNIRSLDDETNKHWQKRGGDLFSILGDSLTARSFIPKSAEKIADWKLAYNSYECDKKICCDKCCCVASIEDVIKEVVSLPKDKPVCEKSWLARALTWYKTMSPKDFARAAGLEEPVSEGYLSCEENRFFWHATLPGTKNWVYLSPGLRSLGKMDFAKLIGTLPQNARGQPLKLGEFEFPPSRNGSGASAEMSVIAAATPLTGCSAVGRSNALKVMQQKIGALLDKAFDRVVLKTVYLNNLDKDERDEIGDLAWPELQIQSLHRARCYRSAAHPRTLWNTGTTAQEAFSPEMMNEFLKECVNGSAIPAERIIVSLGSKFPDDEQRKIKTCESLENRLRVVWSKLFSTVFQDLKGKPYTDVEINVRHYLRGCINANLGGDEYLSPTTVPASGAVFGNYHAVDEEFKQWLSVVNDVALEHGKHLYLKMPFRGDLIHFIGLIMAVKKEKGESKNAIKGLVFVNAFKSALKEPEEPSQYSPAWYGSTKSWNDRKDDGNHGSPLSMRCQVSGELLQLSRNQLLFAVAKAAKAANLELQIGGGVIDHEDLLFCSKFSQLAGAEEDLLNAVQIGTWGLMDLRLGSYMGNAGKLDAAVPCGKETRPHEGKGACTSNRPSIGENLCPRIAFCLHELCNGCGKCSRSFYCDTFLDRRGHDLPPVMDARNCTGCGLCAQICPNGAIQLFRPEDMVMLFAESKDILLTWHRRLDACEIPHLCYMAEDIRGLVQKPDCRDSDLIQAWYDLCQAEAPHLKKSIVLYAGADESLWGGRVAAGESTDVCQEMRPCPLTWEWKNGVGRLLSKGDPDDWLKDIKREVAKRLNAIKRLNAMRR